MTLEAIRYSRGRLEILDQLLLPDSSQYVEVTGVEDGWQVIKKMQVRGAPAIGVVGALSIAVEMSGRLFSSIQELEQFVQEKSTYLVTARPTAVNISDVANKLSVLSQKLIAENTDVNTMKEKLISACEAMQLQDIADNKAIGKHGAEAILKSRPSDYKVTVLTHCNTGSLATAGYGTALGVVRALHEANRLHHVYCTETRPYNQGARLTAYELVYDKIPATLICDSKAAFLMSQRKVDAVVLGADRIVSNGDTANKIGTYQLAISAKYHGVDFYTAAPSTSCDLNLSSGQDITIEERPHAEMTHIKGQRIAAQGIGCWNPAFDVTPRELITGIITEHGVFTPDQLKEKLIEAKNKQK